MQRIHGYGFILAGFFLIGITAGLAAAAEQETALPSPKLDGTVSVEKALYTRRSIRAYAETPLTLEQVGQLLWAAQGITDPKTGKRTAPSAKAQYFLTVYLAAGRVTGLPEGVFRYVPQHHALLQVGGAQARQALLQAGGQAPLQAAPAALLITGRASRTEWMYLEAGHAAQNVCLQGVALHLGTVTMAGFDPPRVQSALKLNSDEQPIYLMPLGAVKAGE